MRFASLEELNGWLEAECRRWARLHPHPEQREIILAQTLEAERPALQAILAPFDGFHEVEHAVTGTCLITFDRNRYSVMARAAKRTVQVRAYADRIVVRCAGEVVAEHVRSFGEAERSMIPGTTCRFWPASPGACAMARHSKIGLCHQP